MGRPRKHIFHCYTVSTDVADRHGRRYVVTAEYNDGYEIIYRAHHLLDAQLMLDRLNENQTKLWKEWRDAR